MLAKYSDLTKNFFGVLAENSRLGETEKIIESYLELMSAHRGEINVTVTTAQVGGAYILLDILFNVV